MNRKHVERLATAMQLAAVLAKIAPRHVTAWKCSLDAAELVLCGRTAIRTGINICNYGETPRRRHAINRAAATAKELASRYGLKLDTSGDVRGYVFRLHGDKLPSNNLGGGFGLG